MDEIDGMTSDRGGLAELTNMIKTAKIPIVCICNDRNNPRIRTLANHCLDLRFRKLEARQIMPRLKSIIDLENKQMKDSMINEVIMSSNGDLRYCLNTLQNLLLRKTISHEQIKLLTKKNVAKNIFDVASDIFGKRKITDKINLYFEEYSIVPLFVQENYVKMNFRNVFEIRKSTESISFADIVDKHIHGYNQEWGLLPTHAFYSTIYPTHGKNLVKRLDFPTYLGQTSKKNKNIRNLSEMLMHAHSKIKTNKSDFRMYTCDILFYKYVNALIKERVDDAIQILVDFDLIKSDVDNLNEIIFDGAEQMKNVTTKIKSQFTRNLKKIKRNLPYSVDDVKTAINTEENESDG
ncbi:DNA replication factor C complex subunit Rfc1 [Binucleata daphniae]